MIKLTSLYHIKEIRGKGIIVEFNVGDAVYVISTEEDGVVLDVEDDGEFFIVALDSGVKAKINKSDLSSNSD